MISVLCPTRNRPANVRRLLESVRDTAQGEVEVIFRTDDDARLEGPLPYPAREVHGPRIMLAEMWNECYRASRGDIVMQCGDDIVFRTPGWDVTVAGEFARFPDRIALVYGNDLLHGQALATHGFLHRRWVETVGRFNPPYFSCDYVDQWLFDVARMVDRASYLPGVITEHCHPVIGKAPWDQTHMERLQRGQADGVAARYAETLPERQLEAGKLQAAIQAHLEGNGPGGSGPAGLSSVPGARASPRSRGRLPRAVRYLVTGGAGFVGSSLVWRLCRDGHEVRVLDNMSRGNPRRLDGAGCEVVYGDVRDPGAVTRAMQGCGSVVHLAYLQGTQTFYAEPRAVLDVALRGILNVLDACERTACSELLLISSSEAYQVAPVVPTPESVPLTVPDPLNPRYSYGGGKIACELAALAWQRAGVLDRAVIARPHNIYGPDMGWEHVIPEFALRMSELAAAQPSGIIPFPIQGTGQETRSFCYISDCTAQLAQLAAGAGTGGEIYNVGTMDEHTIADVAEAVAACFGREIKVVPGSLPKGSPPRRLPDTARIAALGYPGPQVSFTDGLEETVAWYRDWHRDRRG